MQPRLTSVAEPAAPEVPSGIGDVDQLWGQVRVLERQVGRLHAEVATHAPADLRVWGPVAQALAHAMRTLHLAAGRLPARPPALTAESRSVLQVDRLVIERQARRVLLAGRPVELPRMCFALLEQLATEPARVFTRQELLRGVWEWRGTGTGRTRTVDSHASRLRCALRAADPDGPAWVVNRWGIGYALLAHPIPAPQPETDPRTVDRSEIGSRAA